MSRYRTWLLSVLLVASSVNAETIAVIGTGNVGMALGTEFASQGHTIIYGSRNPDGLKATDLVARTAGEASAALPGNAARAASVVVIAVPGMVVETVVRGLGDLGGKIVIDVTNPLTRTAALEFEHGVATSNGEIIQSVAPDARVVKAFNTIAWPDMIEPARAGGPLTVPIAGDDENAKQFVATLARGMGLEPLDIGPLRYARWTEMAAVIKLNNEFSNRRPFNLHLRQIGTTPP